MSGIPAISYIESSGRRAMSYLAGNDEPVGLAGCEPSEPPRSPIRVEEGDGPEVYGEGIYDVGIDHRDIEVIDPPADPDIADPSTGPDIIEAADQPLDPDIFDPSSETTDLSEPTIEDPDITEPEAADPAVDPEVTDPNMVIDAGDPDIIDAEEEIPGPCLNPPNPFNLISPANFETGVTNYPTFSWENTTDPDAGDSLTYTLEVSDDPIFIAPLIVRSDLTLSEYTLESAEPVMCDNTYYWRVSATDTCGQTSRTGISNFSTYLPTLEWIRTYNGSANSDDEGNGIAVDELGNVYATGMEIGSEGGANIWIGKYDNDGSPRWTQIYNGPANLGEIGQAIGVDSFSDAYVIGEELLSPFPPFPQNIWLRKNDPDGSELWTETFEVTTWDYGYDIAVDRDGNSFITGIIRVTEEDGTRNSNMWLGRYDSGGSMTAFRFFDYGDDEGRGIAIDRGTGNIFVTGEVDSDIFIGKFDINLSPLLSPVFYNHPSDGYDVGNGVAVDSLSGNVYVIGTVSVSGEGRNIFIRSYDNNLNPVSPPFIYNGSGNGDDYGNGIAVNDDGDIYMVGTEYTAREDSNVLIMRLNSGLHPLCIQTYNNPDTNGDDRGNDVAVSNPNDVYVTGYETITGEDRNILIMRHSGF